MLALGEKGEDNNRQTVPCKQFKKVAQSEVDKCMSLITNANYEVDEKMITLTLKS